MLFCALMLVACGTQGQSMAAENNNETASNEASAPAGAGSVPSNHGHTQDMTNRTGAAALKEIFIRVGTIDGKPIKDFQLRSRCQTAFVTADGDVLIDWSKVGNYAGRYANGKESFAIDDGKGTHTISVPTGQHPEPVGNAGARVDGGMSVIADSCEQ
jgi:hypothetical protein